MRPLNKLGKNNGGYFGETIDIEAVLRDIKSAAEKRGFTQKVFFQKENFKLLGLKRSGSDKGHKIYISTGIHGDEPAGPLAALKLIEEDQWKPDLNIWFCPCLNPLGFTLNCRENEKTVDLNRDYKDPKTPEIRAHIMWLEKQPDFDLSLCLHEDWEAKGFYIYSIVGDNSSLGREMIKEVGKIFPIDLSTIIEKFPAKDGIIRSNIDSETWSDWPEAFYLRKDKKGLHFTLETSSDFPLQTRVDALVRGVRTAVATLESKADN